MRYQFYREHKYVSSAVNDVQRQIGRMDACDSESVAEALAAFENVVAMLEGHAQYEDERIHALLKAKGSSVHDHAEEDHAHLDEQLNSIRAHFNQVKSAATDDERISFGYQLYLEYCKFASGNQAHLYLEETEILPELQRLYSDDELRQVEGKTYREMTPDQIVGMLEILFPYMNRYDRKALLTDIHELEPEKFALVWKQIGPSLSEAERAWVKLDK